MNLLYKELRLAAHPNLFIFMFMGALLMIPDYPFCVVFLFGVLGPYITFFYDRETRDTYFTALLPVQKRDAVKGKCMLICFAQLGQLLISVPYAVLRQAIYPDGNSVGIDANVAYYGLGLIMFAVFDFIFLIVFYKTAYKIGRALILALIPFSAIMFLTELAVHTPYLSWLDGTSPANLANQLPILASGAFLYALALILAYMVAGKRFLSVDL